MNWIGTTSDDRLAPKSRRLPAASAVQTKCELAQRVTRVLLVAALLLPMLVSVPARGDESSPALKLVCDVGPIEKGYGGTDWLVYSCNDRRSVVITAAAGSPASPFVFRFLARENAYLLQSMGTGDRKFTSAAFNELKGMSAQDIEMLVTLTRASAEQ